MKKYSFNEVSNLDDSLYALATYEVTEGKIVIPDGKNDVYSLQKKISNKFNYFKELIHRGECDFDFIQYKVLSTYGPFVREKEIKIDDLTCESITSYIDREEGISKENDDMISGIFGALLKSFQNSIPEEGSDLDLDYDDLDDIDNDPPRNLL